MEGQFLVDRRHLSYPMRQFIPRILRILVHAHRKQANDLSKNDISNPVLRCFRSLSYKQLQPRPWPRALPSIHWIPECIWPILLPPAKDSKGNVKIIEIHFISLWNKRVPLALFHHVFALRSSFQALCHIHSFCHHLDCFFFFLRPEGLQGCLGLFSSLSLFSRHLLHHNYSLIGLLSFLPSFLFIFILSLISISTHHQL